jgi:alanyl-tRNA synthetase
MADQKMSEKADATGRLYFDDPYRIEFEAQVLEKRAQEGETVLILDRTCFYPDSGGQPSDRGTINEVEVSKVTEEEGVILHYLKEDVAGAGVRGRVDWPTRFDHMQQHTGQHILSQSFYELLAGETLSFHLGAETATVEIGLARITEEEVDRVESRANAIVFEDRDIRIYFVPQPEIGRIPLRKPPQKEGLIRVVEVSDFDYSACGGTHCRRTGEVGSIKITKWERIRNNIRFDFVCGTRALRDFGLKTSVARKMSALLSVQEREVPEAAARILADLKALRKKEKRYQEKIALYEAQEIIARAPGPVIKAIWTDKTPEEARFLALNIIKRGRFVVLYGVRAEARDHLILACSESLGLDIRELIPLLSPLLKGKGGGSSSLVEIVTEEKGRLDEALEEGSRLAASKI